MIKEYQNTNFWKLIIHLVWTIHWQVICILFELLKNILHLSLFTVYIYIYIFKRYFQIAYFKEVHTYNLTLYSNVKKKKKYEIFFLIKNNIDITQKKTLIRVIYIKKNWHSDEQKNMIFKIRYIKKNNHCHENIDFDVTSY